mgnify:CR=1 FL=1
MKKNANWWQEERLHTEIYVNVWKDKVFINNVVAIIAPIDTDYNKWYCQYNKKIYNTYLDTNGDICIDIAQPSDIVKLTITTINDLVAAYKLAHEEYIKKNIKKKGLQ